MSNNIIVKIDGQQILDIYNFTFEKKIDDFNATASLDIYRPKKSFVDFDLDNGTSIEINNKSIIQIYIGGLEDKNLCFTGLITTINTTEDRQEVITRITLKEKTIDIAESNFVPGSRVYNIDGKLNLVDLTKTILEKQGYTITNSKERFFNYNQINIDNEVEDLEISVDNQELKGLSLSDLTLTKQGQAIAQSNQTIFDFLSFYANQIGAFLTTTEKGDLIFFRPNFKTKNAVAKIINRFPENPAEPNNATKIDSFIDYNNRFYSYYCYGINDTNGASKISKKPPIIDNEIRNTRHLTYQSNDDLNDNLTRQKASLFAMTQKARSQYLLAVMEGLTHGGIQDLQNNTPWRVNDLVKVIDYKSGTDTILLVKKVVFNVNKERAETQLELVDPNCYAQINLKAEKKDNVKFMTKSKKIKI